MRELNATESEIKKAYRSPDKDDVDSPYWVVDTLVGQAVICERSRDEEGNRIAVKGNTVWAVRGSKEAHREVVTTIKRYQ